MWLWRPRTIPEAMEWLAGRFVSPLNWCLLRTKTSCWYGHVCLILTDFTGGLYAPEMAVDITVLTSKYPMWEHSQGTIIWPLGKHIRYTSMENAPSEHPKQSRAGKAQNWLQLTGLSLVWGLQRCCCIALLHSSALAQHEIICSLFRVTLPFIKPKELPYRRKAPTLLLSCTAVKELLQLIPKTQRVLFFYWLNEILKLGRKSLKV